jgi:DNA sulfur modification protein DndB
VAEKLQIVTFPTLDEAKSAARNLSEDIGLSTSFPVTIFRQGTRSFISTVFSIHFIINFLRTNATEKDKGVSDVRKAMNRPIDVPHAKVTKDYIKRNYKSKYILPAMTLNVQDDVKIFTVDAPGTTITPGFMVMPFTVKFSVTDGQHRKKALGDLFKELSTEEYDSLKNDGIPVMITIEDDINQTHQDFADCSKTKPLPKSLIAVYDKRNPANSLVLDIVDNCPLFKNKVDATRATLSKKSTKLMLVSQVRSFLKELVVANSATGDVDFETRMQELFTDANSETYKKSLEKFKAYINKLTAKIPVLKEVSELTGEGLEMTTIPLLRSKYLILNSGGLNILGRIGHELCKEPLWQEVDGYIDKLANIEWEKSADMWQGNIVAKGAKGLKISTSNSTLKAAVEAVKIAIGLPVEQKPANKDVELELV